MSEIGVDALGHPLEFPDEFKDWLSDYVASTVPMFAASQVFGFQLERCRTATTDASENTSSTSYTNLSTVGPTLSDLANGWYLLIFGADVANSTTAGGPQMSPSINGAAASDNDSVKFVPLYPSPARTSQLRVLLVHLNTPGGVNEIIMKYKVASGNADFQFRYLHAIKVISTDE